MNIVCAQCSTTNRVPAERLGEDPKCGKCHAALLDGRPAALDESKFDAFISNSELPVVVDFWADWCQPCHAMAPQFARAAAELKARARFAKVNTEEAQPIAARFGICSIPTLILFRGGREVSRLSGARDAPSIIAWVISGVPV